MRRGRALQALLGYLRGLGVVPPAGSRVAPTPAGELLDRYAEHLLVQRGLTLSTVRNYCNHARAFLADRERIADELALEALYPAAINEYVVRVAARERLLDAVGRACAAVAAAVPAAGGAD